jgi:hypothetical protein
MTTVTSFRPTATSLFQFQPTLDGQVYTAVTTWNVYGQRWYINIYSLNGSLVVAQPLIASPDDADISLTAGYFDSVMVFRESSQQFEVSP